MNSSSWLQQFNPPLRSLLFFDLYQEHPTVEQMIPTLCARFRFLRVLEFGCFNGRSGWTLPKDIDKLILLKYLGLRDTLVQSIPPSILNLSNLETLDLLDQTRSGVTLPTEICKLQNLRHLIGNFGGQYFRIDNMKNLQTLKCIGDDTWTKTNPEKLVNLRELHVSFYRERQDEITFDSFAKLKNLRILSVILSRNDFFASLQPLSHCRHLLHLSLNGKMEKLPEEMPVLLPNLERLSMWSSKLVDDPMPTLEKMLNLTVLDIWNDCYLGKKLVCTAKGFPRLEILLVDAKDLEEWQVEDGAMPVLRGLNINNNSRFRIPERLRSIPRPDEWESYKSYDGDSR
ncbi:putative disease resistance RPP13-like protein 2 [Pistacia vera]|uniref:putative disease resistance RPP13-like protein 2 n=1 Tax=Pistacia vera TaxID=55513 RepID=UPI001262F5CA|nr:putative disease resistance RPP13-like protein 2 [Pistacia vera]